MVTAVSLSFPVSWWKYTYFCHWKYVWNLCNLLRCLEGCAGVTVKWPFKHRAHHQVPRKAQIFLACPQSGCFPVCRLCVSDGHKKDPCLLSPLLTTLSPGLSPSLPLPLASERQGTRSWLLRRATVDQILIFLRVEHCQNSIHPPATSAGLQSITLMLYLP